MATPDEPSRIALYGEIQDLLDTDTLIVPLYAPRRVTVVSLRTHHGRLFVLRSSMFAPRAANCMLSTRLLSVSAVQSNSWLPIAAAA